MNYAHSIIKITRILLSCMHAWYLDSTLDDLFVEKLGLFRPKVPISFGYISRHHAVTIMFPNKLNVPRNHNERLNSVRQFSNYDLFAEFTSKQHWNISKGLTTTHLLTLLSIANAFMSLQKFIDLQFRVEYVDYRVKLISIYL